MSQPFLRATYPDNFIFIQTVQVAPTSGSVIHTHNSEFRNAPLPARCHSVSCLLPPDSCTAPCTIVAYQRVRVKRHRVRWPFSLRFPRGAAPGALDLAFAVTFRAVLSSYHQDDLHALTLAPRTRNRAIAVTPWAFSHFTHAPFRRWRLPEQKTQE